MFKWTVNIVFNAIVYHLTASQQINVAEVNDKGVVTGHKKTYVLCGDAINQLTYI